MKSERPVPRARSKRPPTMICQGSTTGPSAFSPSSLKTVDRRDLLRAGGLGTSRVCADIYFGFVLFYDDDTYVYENPMVKAGLSGAAIAWAMTTYRLRQLASLDMDLLPFGCSTLRDKSWSLPRDQCRLSRAFRYPAIPRPPLRMTSQTFRSALGSRNLPAASAARRIRCVGFGT